MRTGGRRSSRRAIATVIGVCLAAMTGCSGGNSERSADELRPPASFTADERVVIDTYARFREELTRATAAKDRSLDTVEALASPRLAEALIDTIVGDRSVGNVIQGTYEFVPLVVTFDGDESAQILLCEWDQTFIVNEGDQLTKVPAGPSVARVDLRASEGKWLVNGVGDGGGQACELGS